MKLALAIQGGAMRSIYCLGAVRALIESGVAPHFKSIYVSSAGCVAGAVLASHITRSLSCDSQAASSELVERLAGDRFINFRRIKPIVDVDYLVGVINEVTNLKPEEMRQAGIDFVVALTNPDTGRADYINIARLEDVPSQSEALCATMAIPVLYPREVKVRSLRASFVDGGIADPLPLVRAMLEQGQDVDAFWSISSVRGGTLGAGKSGKDALILRLFPGIKPDLRRLMLSRNVLADATEDVMSQGAFLGKPVFPVVPSAPELLGSRTEKDSARLMQLEELGFRDATAVALAWSHFASQTGDS